MVRVLGDKFIKHTVQSTWTIVTSRQCGKELDLLFGLDSAL